MPRLLQNPLGVDLAGNLLNRMPDDHCTTCDTLVPHSGPSIGRRARVKAATPCGVPALTLRAPTSPRPSMGSQGEPCQGTRRPDGRRLGVRRPMARMRRGVDTDHGLAVEVLVDNLRSQLKPDSAYPGPEGPGLRRY